MAETECPYCEAMIPIPEGSGCYRVQCQVCKTILSGCHK